MGQKSVKSMKKVEKRILMQLEQEKISCTSVFQVAQIAT
jgi:hypothetical protein